MTAHSRSRLVNPLLGTYFSILAAALVAAVLLLVMLEQLGTSDRSLRISMALGSLALFAAVGGLAWTSLPAEFLVSGRRVPAFFCGLILATAAIGGTGLVAFTGSLFLIGFDALCLCMGVVAGLVAAGILIVPFLRKFGAPTLPGYFGRRFESPAVRILAASIAAPPLILLLVAELKVALGALAMLTGFSDATSAYLLAGALILTLAPGGFRSLSWSASAQGLAVFLALLVPVAIVSVLLTNFPIGQLSHGPVLRALGRAELQLAIPVPPAALFGFELPGPDLHPIVGRFATPFVTIGPAAFILAVLSIMAGIAGSPSLLVRGVTTPSVYETRKAIGWSVFLAGVTIMTMATVAVFMRDALISTLVGPTPSKILQAIKSLVDAGLAGIDGRVPQLSVSSFYFKRDGVLIALPMMMRFPPVLVHVAAAGILAAALVGAGAALTTFALSLAEDVINAPEVGRPVSSMRLYVARGVIIIVSGLAVWAATATPGDPLDLLLWSLALSGSSIFPVLLLSIWWKRLNAWGVMAGQLAGFSIAMLALLAGEPGGPLGVPGVLAPIAGAPISFLAAMLTSLFTPSPTRAILETVRDLRVPSGEPIYDRDVRLNRQRRRG